MDVIYFIEHVSRELDIACAVKAVLEKREGISVKIVSLSYGLDEALSGDPPRVVVLPQCNGVFRRPPEKMLPRWPDARYISLSFEQVLGKAQLEYMKEKDEFTRNFVLHSVWGDFYKDILITTGVEAENIRVNGSPTLNLYRPPYSQFYFQERAETARKYGLSPEKRWIFIPGNYGWAFFSGKLVRDRIQRGFDPTHAYQYRDFANQSLKDTAEWWCHAWDSPDFELIVRPRPATPEAYYRERIDSFELTIPPHMHIIKEGSVREWIMLSDIVMSSFSTTLIEAAVYHKPIYMLTPVPLPDFLHSEWYDYVAKITTFNEFEAVCTGPLEETNWQDLDHWIEKTLFSGGDAIQNIATMISSVLGGSVALEPPTHIARQISRPTPYNLYRRSRKLMWNVYQRTVNAFGYRTPEQKRQAHEKDHFSPQVIAAKVSQWEAVLGLSV